MLDVINKGRKVIMNIYTNNNITRNYGRNNRQASQALSSLNTPLLNNSVKSNQNDKFENKNKKNFFQNIKDNIKRLFNCCNPKAKEDPAVDNNEQRNSFSSIDSNLRVDDGDIHQGLYIIEKNTPQKKGSSPIPILVKHKKYNAYDLISKNTSSPLSENYESVSLYTSNSKKTPTKTLSAPSSSTSFYPHSYDTNEEWVKKYFNEKISNLTDSLINDVPVESYSSYSSYSSF